MLGPRRPLAAPMIAGVLLGGAGALLGACGGDPVSIPLAPVTAPPSQNLPDTTLAAPPPEPRPAARRRRRPPPKARASLDPLPAAGAVPGAPPHGILRLPDACCSEDRGGRRVDAIVLHTTESSGDEGYGELVRLARFFVRVRRSSHVANDAEGYSSRMVPDGRSAYHSTYWNIATLGIEQVGFASMSRGDWLDRPAQLESTARWIAHWSGRHRIPIRRCEVVGLRYNRRKRVVAGRITRRGVCSHRQVDPRNRSDPGATYPWDVVLRRAREIADAAG